MRKSSRSWAPPSGQIAEQSVNGAALRSGKDRSMAKLRTLAPLVRTVDPRPVKPPPSRPTFAQRFKARDPFYATPEFRAWRAKVIARAGGRCEAIAHGYRCTKAQPAHRMFADHRIELS